MPRRRDERRRRDILALLAEAVDGMYSIDIGKRAHVRVGRLYPLLHRLENEGRIRGDFELGPEPRRRVYRFVR
jgi:DNA-binding PadR family transcriptional regulator